MKKNTQVTVSSTSTLDAKRDVDLEKLPAAKLAPSSSSLSSTVAGSDNSTPSRFQQFTSKFRSKKSKCQTSAASQPSLASRLKEYLTYDPRDVNRSMLDLNLYQRFRTRLSRLIKALRLVLFLIILWLSLNVPIVLWQYFYIQAKVRPYDYKKLINNKHGWRAFEGLMYFVGFVMMMINFVAGWLLLTMAYERCRGLFGCDQTATRRRFPLIRTITKPIRALILVACCLIGLAFVLMLAAEVFWGPLAALPLAWKHVFRGSCDDFGVRVWLDSKAYSPAKSVEFKRYEPLSTYRMEFKPDPQESDDFYNVFSLDPGYIPSSNQFVPSYDSVHYNFTDLTYSTKLNNVTTHQGGFELHPRLRIPDLHLEADIQGFARSDAFEAFLKVYSTATDDAIVDKKHAWSDNTNVVMRTAKFKYSDKLQVCMRGPNDGMDGLGDMTPVPVGLLILVRDGRKIIAPGDHD